MNATFPRESRSEGGPDGLMVFDGLCNFCSAQVQLILRMDKAGMVRFTSIQSRYGRHLAARFGIDPDDPSTFFFFDCGQPLEASDAVIAMVRRLPRPWRWLTMLRVIPRPPRDAAYRLIARNRYRLPTQGSLHGSAAIRAGALHRRDSTGRAVRRRALLVGATGTFDRRASSGHLP